VPVFYLFDIAKKCLWISGNPQWMGKKRAKKGEIAVA
jgi:hypothetical protein